MLQLSKENSKVIKGIAILLMLFYHLFNYDNAEACINFFHMGGVPLASWLARACNPVAIFLLLSVVSYILAVPVMWAARAIYQRILPNK